MKSSTVRRSTLSQEAMDVIEALSREQDSDSVGEYYRPEEIAEKQSAQKEFDFNSKAQEIDLLWQNFKTTQFNTNSPTAYVSIGFVSGVITTVLVMFLMGTFSGKTDFAGKNFFGFLKNNNQVEETTLDEQADIAQETVEAKVSVPSDDETASENNQIQNTQQEETVSEQQPAQADINTAKTKKYIVKSGDTGESIIKHFYGSYTPERAEAIIKINNLKNLDRINIDQELLIPVE